MQRSPSPRLSLYGHDGRRKYLTPTERAAFIAAALRHPRREVGAFGLFIAYSGCRISEALELRCAGIERQDAFAAIRCLKKRNRTVIREVPLPHWMVDHLSATCDLGDGLPQRHIWPWSRGHAWLLIHQLMELAGIASGPHATAKGLRHGFAIHALRSGVPINMVKRWLGHASLATTEIYLDAIGEEEREFASRMWIDVPATDGT